MEVNLKLLQDKNKDAINGSMHGEWCETNSILAGRTSIILVGITKHG